MSRSAPWVVNAARRTLVTAFPGLARPADAWAAARLAPAEARLFLSLPPQERAHGIEVARRLLASSPHASPSLVKAALLQDVGKPGTPQLVLWRVLTHLLPAASVPAEPRLRGLAGARQARVHHARYGAELIRQAGGDAAVVELVARHHAAPTGDLATEQANDLARLRAADERT